MHCGFPVWIEATLRGRRWGFVLVVLESFGADGCAAISYSLLCDGPEVGHAPLK